VDLVDALTHTGTTRYFKPDAVPDEVLWRAFDAARFAPQGGNRQPLRWIVVRDQARKRRLKELYMGPWLAYVQRLESGATQLGASNRTLDGAKHMADHLDEVPAIVVACAELASIFPTDAKLERVSVVGGGSIYPAIQSFMLALRGEGVGSAMTTLLCISEPEVRELLAIPEGILTAAHIAVGYPARPWPRRLTRRPVSEVVLQDDYGTPFAPQLHDG
jgi:nitroreductase